MSNLPDKKLIKVTYKFEDGREFVIEGEDVRTYEMQIKSASLLGISHGFQFKSIEWKEIKKSELKKKESNS
jgi:hypothetical protein